MWWSVGVSLKSTELSEAVLPPVGPTEKTHQSLPHQFNTDSLKYHQQIQLLLTSCKISGWSLILSESGSVSTCERVCVCVTVSYPFA